MNDIISHTPLKYQAGKSIGLLDYQVTNRKKGITEIADLKNLASVNPNLDY